MTQMKSFKIPFLLLFAILVTMVASEGGRQGPQQGFGGGNHMNRGYQGAQGGRGGRGFQGGNDQGIDGRQSYARQDGRKYRTNLYNDDMIYGYDAIYPNGEAGYINYKSKEARTRIGTI